MGSFKANTISKMCIFSKAALSKILSTQIIVRQRSTIDQESSHTHDEKCKQYVSEMKEFRHRLSKAKNVIFLTGSRITEESGIPSFSGPGPVWRRFTDLTLSHPHAFCQSPSLIWEYYNYRRELAAKARPNSGHIAIANYELRMGYQQNINIITQNIDNLHSRAGSANMIELNGNLFYTRCTKCKKVEFNADRPIVPALANTGSPDVNAKWPNIPEECLPRCSICCGLLRPHVVWFGESIDEEIIRKANEAVRCCEICLVVGSPTLTYPAYTYPTKVLNNGGIVAEFDNALLVGKPKYNFYFEGLTSRTLPFALADL